MIWVALVGVIAVFVGRYVRAATGTSLPAPAIRTGESHKGASLDDDSASKWVTLNRIEIVIGALLLVPAGWFLHWFVTNPQRAGDLMIFGGMVAIGATVAIIVGTTLLIGGTWGDLRLPGRVWAHVVPLLTGLGIARVLWQRLLH